MPPLLDALRTGGAFLPRRRLPSAPVVRDLLLWAAFAVLIWSSWVGHRGYPVRALVGGLLLWGVAVALSRRWPVVALFTVVALCVLDGNYSLALPVVSYLLGRRTASIRPAAVGYPVIAFVGTAMVLPRAGFVDWATMAGALIYAGVFPWLVGRYRRQQRELVAAGWEHAEQLERAQRILASEVRLRERARIAEDMHDSLGHELSLLALRAGALELTPTLGERERAMAGQLRLGAATATERLREIVHLLRAEDEEPTAPPAGESLDELVRRAAGAGMRVTLRREEPPDGEAEEAYRPVLVERAAYRVVQEALTNASKHAPGAGVAVRLRQAGTETVVSVVNDPAPGGGREAPVRAAPTDGGGRGLIGLRERVRLAGGTLSAGERDGGFEVVARLPHRAVPAPEPVPDSGPISSTHRRRLVHREARRGLVAAAGVLTTLAVALGGSGLGYYLWATSNSVLPPHRYAALRLAQEEAAVEPLLPRREMLEPPDPDPLAAPAGSDCHYYRSHGDVLRAAGTVYRLCFAGGRLVAKDAIPA
ncbi:sensor histidine kinase [Plantactinospora sp. CA-290183]|uniref:sensor histidine kinase n=1 Tax=Plantactinospora sp. CA-290183 TaxID=3240006 RepID=UPI003D8CD0FE